MNLISPLELEWRWQDGGRHAILPRDTTLQETKPNMDTDIQKKQAHTCYVREDASKPII